MQGSAGMKLVMCVVAEDAHSHWLGQTVWANDVVGDLIQVKRLKHDV